MSSAVMEAAVEPADGDVSVIEPAGVVCAALDCEPQLAVDPDMLPAD